MSLRARFYLAFASSFVAIGAHLVANHFYLYWTMPNIDVPIHILGGIMAGLYVGTLFFALKKPQTWLVIALGTLAVGIGWELLEVLTHAVDVTDWWYPYDTAKDLLDDLIGGSIAYLIWKRL